MEIGTLWRLLTLAGSALLVLGLALVLLERVPLLGHLPGDILFRRGSLTVSIPLATTLVLSLLLSLLLTLIVRFLR